MRQGTSPKKNRCGMITFSLSSGEAGKGCPANVQRSPLPFLPIDQDEAA